MSTTTRAATTKTARGVRVAVAAGLALGGLLVVAAPAQALTTDRWWGADRFATAAAVSGAAFSGGAKGVVVVNGGSSADALAAAPLAAKMRVPLLTVTSSQLPDATRTELARLSPQRVWVVGGTAVVSDDVVAQVGRFAAEGATRLQGTDRYDTAAKIATNQFADSADEVFVASGQGFADALAAGAAGAALGAPLLLTAPDSLPQATAAAVGVLQPSRITVVGGPSVVADDVLTQLAAGRPGVVVRRLSGDDRYATAAKVLLDRTQSDPHVLLASGANFPDALAGAALGQPLLLSRPDCLPQVTADAYATLGTSSVTGLGGAGVLSDAALAGKVCAPAAEVPAPVSSPALSSSPKASDSAPKTVSGSSPSSWKNCSDVRAAGKAPIRRGDPGFQAKFDRDGDGVGCE